jgi:hypothetical protein
MTRHRRIEPFFLVITDRDKGLFNVIGPMTDDTMWNNMVSEEQDKGRNVKCHNPGLKQSKLEIITNIQTQLGLKFTDQTLV